jgi:hypothetical protein
MSLARAFALVSFAVSVAALGCGSEETAPPAAPAAPAPPEPAAAAPAPAPEAAAIPTPEWSGELPPDFPADVPRHPGSKVTSARGTEDLGVAVSLSIADGVDAVAKFYADGLAAQSWQTQTQVTPEGTMVFADKEGRRAQALVHAGGDGTLVDLIIAPVQ